SWRSRRHRRGATGQSRTMTPRPSGDRTSPLRQRHGPSDQARYPPTPHERNAVKLTGERPMQGATPDSLLALHDAGYREVVARLGPGLVLDVGCGVGDETARLDGGDRVVVGVDYSAQTAQEAATEWGPGGPQGKEVRFAAMDGASLGLREDVVDWACSSHIIEHFTNPALHV